ncbi:hypothetical protein [Rhizobium leguminosarum]|uniref:hypothetical protein n=1 Tax=Rhizobium leguminosarum TaxID=384 RepID=UPI001FE127E1|nr:hypothetical protein [Rhizobium leguminosarum]
MECALSGCGIPLKQIFVSPLPSAKTACQYGRMKFAAFQRLLCVFAMLGVILGPVSIGMAESAMASSGHSAMAKMEMPSASAETHSMTGDMPCCPNEKQPPIDCSKNCPLALICASLLLVQAPDTESLSVSFPGTPSLSIGHDANLASVLVEPPARPPRL